MSESSVTPVDLPGVVEDPQRVAAEGSPTPVIITGQEVTFSTAAAVLSPRRPRQLVAAFLEQACLSREMHRL